MIKKRRQAAALSYGKGQQAPQLTAKGKGLVADNIIERAKEHNVPIMEDASLVELLTQLNINETIPEDLYEAVAEVFAYVYQIDKRFRS